MSRPLDIPLDAGDVLLYRAKGIFGWLISFKTVSTIAHIEVYDGNGVSVASRDGHGVNRYPLRLEGLAYVLRPNEPFDRAAAQKWFTGVQGRPYGWLDLLNFAMPTTTLETEGMFCSEFAIGYLRMGGIPLAHQEPAVKISPRDFRLFEALDEVWPEDCRILPVEAA